MMNNNMNVNLAVGDKIKLVEPIGPLGEQFVGDVYEITKYENGLYYFECPYGMGRFTPNEFDAHFEIASEDEGEQYDEHISMWQDMVDAYRNMMAEKENENCDNDCCCHGCNCHDDGSIYMDENEDFELELGDDVPEFVEELLENSEIECSTVFDCCAVVSCKLPNGYILVEHSAMSDPDYYDYATEVKHCMDKIVKKVTALEVYVDMTMNAMEESDMPNANVDIDVDKINKRIKQALADEERKKRDEETLSELDEILDKKKNKCINDYDLNFRMNPWWK